MGTQKTRNRNRSALGPKLHEPTPPATKEIALSAAEAEGCRALWAERIQAVKALQEIEARLTRAISSVTEAHGVRHGVEVRIDFEKGVITVPAAAWEGVPPPAVAKSGDAIADPAPPEPVRVPPAARCIEV